MDIVVLVFWLGADLFVGALIVTIVTLILIMITIHPLPTIHTQEPMIITKTNTFYQTWTRTSLNPQNLPSSALSCP